MSVRRETISISGPAGTVVSTRPISGEIVEVRYNGTDLNAASATADWTITRKDGGGTVLALTDVAGPWQYAPRQSLHTTTGGTLTHEATSAGAGAQVGPIPVDGHLQVVLAQAGTATDSIHVFYRC